MLKSGIIGCGGVTRFRHVPVIETLDDIEVEWVCDLDEERARELGTEHGIDYYTDVDEALSNEVDLVHVNTPPSTHADLTVQALETGYHVLVEKPMAMSVEEGERMYDVAEETGKELCVVHSNRFTAPVQRVMKGIEAGEYGEIVHAQSFLGRERNPGESRDWVSGLHGGTLGEHIPHVIYLVTDFLDDIEHLSVVGNRGEDGMNAVSVQLSSGDSFGHIQANREAPPAKMFEVFGTKGRAYVDLYNYVAVEFDTVEPSNASIITDNLSAAYQFAASTVKSGVEFGRYALTDEGEMVGPGHYRLIQQYASSIRNGTPAPVSRGEALRVMEVLDAIEDYE